MSTIEVDGRALALNEEGFLADPDDWDESVALALAKEAEGLDELSDDHWAVVKIIRDHYVEKKMAPMIRKICKATGLRLTHIFELFPSGPAKGACKVAGLPKPDGCV